MRAAFSRYAGADARMDQDEFVRFTKSLGMSEQNGARFWRMFFWRVRISPLPVKIDSSDRHFHEK